VRRIASFSLICGTREIPYPAIIYVQLSAHQTYIYRRDTPPSCIFIIGRTPKADALSAPRFVTRKAAYCSARSFTTHARNRKSSFTIPSRPFFFSFLEIQLLIDCYECFDKPLRAQFPFEMGKYPGTRYDSVSRNSFEKIVKNIKHFTSISNS